MLDQFVQRLKPIVQYKILKDNLTTFLDACMIARGVSQLDNYLDEMHPSVYIYLQYNSKYTGMQYNNLTGYTLMELDTVFATRIKNSLNITNTSSINLIIFKI